ncbi:carboxylesterase/lipase family protein [Millisia brevis]|uniref:carboxylesterase/lipase family protein n=1 Tax=Millisia brevis TaxID=264148 RepID=UPI0009FC9304|nr:carboxylesterase/lipase family protein [Millisia brevis]
MGRTQETIVSTVEGMVRGRRAGTIDIWRGIPYAVAPTGSLRWRAPQPMEYWVGVRDAGEFGDAAPQSISSPPVGPWLGQSMSEDCLSLNVTAPADRGETPLPVMVFIHGGGYIAGSSASPMYDGADLARRDVIYVSINYRLGVLGVIDFSAFSTPDRPIDANPALRDQVAALEWVSRNIAAFGGDPNNVTVFGESAGGGSVVALLAIPAAAGLFHRAIAQSPVADLFVDGDVARDWGRQVAAQLGADVDGDPRAVAATLEDASFEDLARAAARVSRTLLRDQAGRFLYSPSVDGSFLPVHPITACAEGTAHRVPLIIGTNRDEGTLFEYVLKFLPTRPNRLRRLFAATEPTREGRVVTQYPGYPARSAAIRIAGDYTFWAPAVAVAASHSHHAPTYMYRYDYAPRTSRLVGLGATHASELLAVFGFFRRLLGQPLTLLGDQFSAERVTRLIQEQWVTFARTGATRPDWPAYDTDRRATLIIDRHTVVENDPDRAKRLAWSGYRGYHQAPLLPDETLVVDRTIPAPVGIRATL